MLRLENEIIGMTTTVPVEVIFAAGLKPVDINNIFITHPNAHSLVEDAEIAGYPRNLCGWIKGLYSTVLDTEEIRTVIAVTQGDCSNTHALMETLQLQGVKTIPFNYPYDKDKDMLKLQIDKLIETLGTDWEAVVAAKQRLDKIRKKVWEIDRLTWQGNQVTGFENHIFQVSCSDFEGDYDIFEKKVDDFLANLSQAKEHHEDIRVGYIGVPPIIPDLYEYIESIGARVVFNEVQRQFSMPFETDDLVEQYSLYTYPYDVFNRIEDIKKEIETRNLDGIIHYTQSFCFRQIQDLIIREKIDIPILTLEGDRPSKLDARTKMRLDAFIEMLR